MVKNEKGVTLVELLIVIVILGIIAAISVPAVGNIVENAEKDAVLADATTLQQQAETYCASEDNDICDTVDDEPADDTTFFTNEDGDATTLDDYVDVDATYVVAWDGSEWSVAIQTEDYYFVGNPEDASRDDVTDFSDSLELRGTVGDPYDGNLSDVPTYEEISNPWS